MKNIIENNKLSTEQLYTLNKNLYRLVKNNLIKEETPTEDGKVSISYKINTEEINKVSEKYLTLTVDEASN